MAVELTLRTDDRGRMTAHLDGVPLAAPVNLAALPKLPALRAAPYEQGGALTRALGGDALLDRLRADPERLLLLDADEAASAVPWEFAAVDGVQFLACLYAMLRLVERPAPPISAAGAGALQFVVLGADPLVNRQGPPLNIDRELLAVRRTLQASGVELSARRVPPTRDELRRALQQGPAILHLSCHGSVVPTKGGRTAMLYLEDRDGGGDMLRGPDLVALPPPGVLRLVTLSACLSAEAKSVDVPEPNANLARALVENGMPAAIGMQGGFPDTASDVLAEALYGSLLAGYPLGEALRQARLAVSGRVSWAAGLPVGYVARGGWAPLPLRAGTPAVYDLRLSGKVHLPVEVRAPRPLRGRDGELHALARLYNTGPGGEGARVVTVVGTGGMGKTALAAAFVERFGWRWPEGAWAISFAGGEPDAARLRAELLRGLLGEGEAQQWAAAPASEQERAILDALARWDGLILVDNYESVLQGVEAGDGEALAAHRLVAALARGGASLLLTSRQQPAKLAGERVFPRANQPLPGLDADAGTALFLHYSSRARDEGVAGQRLARQVAVETGGHPLAIALLAGEYDQSTAASAEQFLAGWGEELAQAENAGLDPHHVTFQVALARSYRALSEGEQARLRGLSGLGFPFFARAAALLWGLEEGAEGDAQAAEGLARFVHRSLLEVDAQGEDGTPATYRFQPALREGLARLVPEEERARWRSGFAAYGAWLAREGYGDIRKDVALNRLVRLSMEALDAATEALSGAERLWHVRRLAWLKNAYGQVQEAYVLLEGALPPGRPLPDPAQDAEMTRVESGLRYELAGICVTRGDLDRALALYQESLQLDEQLGDKQGKAASLHEMAAVYRTRGDLDRAMELYQESLQLKEQLGDKQGKAASLHEMAEVYRTRGDLDRAMELYQESLQLLEQLGDKQGKAASLHQMAAVYQTRGDLDRALALYQESLKLKEQLGDKEGKATSLSMMCNIQMARGNLDLAEDLAQQALELAQQLGYVQEAAFNIVKLGQVARARGDRRGALVRYGEGLATFVRLGMPRESAQVREMIAALEGGEGSGAASPDPLRQLIAQARATAQAGDAAAAVRLQAQAVALARQAGEEREALVALSVLLYNLAGYMQDAGRFEDAVAALEEVVALDERTGHPDLESDREALKEARRRAATSPEERAAQGAPPAGQDPLPAILAALNEQVAQAPPEERAEMEAAVRRFTERLEGMSVAERAQEWAAMQAAGRQGQVDGLADRARDDAVAVLRGEEERAGLIARLEDWAAQAAEGEEPGSLWDELAQYLGAVVALLRGEAVPPVPERFAARMAAVLAVKRET